MPQGIFFLKPVPIGDSPEPEEHQGIVEEELSGWVGHRTGRG